MVVKTLLYLHLNGCVPVCFLSFLQYLIYIGEMSCDLYFNSPNKSDELRFFSLSFSLKMTFFMLTWKLNLEKINSSWRDKRAPPYLPTMPLRSSAARVGAGHCCSETGLRASWSQRVCERFFSGSRQIISKWLESYKHHVCWECVHGFGEGNISHPRLLNRGMKTRKQKSTRPETSKRKGCF